MMTIKKHEYEIGYATPTEWLNEMIKKYGEDGNFEDFDSALEFALFLGEDFLNFCEKENKK